MSASIGPIAAPESGTAVRPRSPEAGAGRAVAGNGHATGASPERERPPQRADGLELLGTFARSGHRRAPALVRRADGQTIQLTPLLYAVLEAADGERDHEDIAVVAGGTIGKELTAAQVRYLADAKLRPLGLLVQPDGSSPRLRKANPLLGLRLRLVVSNPKTTRRLAAPFALLFYPPIVLAASLAFALLTGWLLFDKGLAAPTRQALYEPALLLIVFGLMMLSAGFHELGHAAACRYGGGTPGAMGVALYLVWPAFYTDVSDAYRLDRRARLRVDLGGIYFNALFALVAFGLWAATGWDALLVVVPLQLFQMVRQLVPLVRLDGYHILADLTGVPDLFAHIKPILTGMLPTRWGRPQNATLKPWVRVVVTAWVVIVVPVLLAILAVIVVVFPRVAATAWDSVGLQWHEARGAWSDSDVTGVATGLLSILAISIPVLSMVYLVARVTRRTARGVWRGTAGRPVMRGVAAMVAVALVAGLATVWWPDDERYQPIRPAERGVLGDIGGRGTSPPGPERIGEELASLSLGERPSSVFPPGPVAPHGVVAVSSSGSGDHSASDPALHSDFRFDLPAPPGEDDNQALAVNYDDGTSIIDMAISLVFAVGDDVVDQSNEAHALASCVACVAAAVAFQLVIVVGDADVVVPENAAVAANAYCVRCATYALAVQLIFSLAEPLSGEAERELALLWSELEELHRNVEKIPLDELTARLMAIQLEIVELLAEEGGVALSGGSDETSEGDPEGAAAPTPSPESSPTSEPSPTAEPSPSPKPSPSSSPSPSPEPSPSSSPSPSSDPSPTSGATPG